MNIIHISHLYHPSEGGVQFWFKNVSERLVKNYGDTVTVVTTNSMFGPERLLFEKIEPQEEVINGVVVKRFAYKRGHIKWMGILFKFFRKLTFPIPAKLIQLAYGPWSPDMKDYLMNAKTDVICASSSNYMFMQMPLWKPCNFFYFGSIHLPEDETKPILTKSQKQAINASSLYIANTNYEKKRLEKAGIKKGKIKVLGVGVDLEFLQEGKKKVSEFKRSVNLPEKALVVGYAGRIEKTKNIILLINSFEKLAITNPDIFLLIAGSGNSYVKHLQEYCKTLPEDIYLRIRWKVNFSMEEKAAIFNCIDILVLPSNNESFGIVFLEAWACKKPVIGAAIGAIKDVISDSEDGLLMEVNHENSLINKLQLLISNASLRKELGENGYKKVSENYTWDIITARLREAYVQAMEKDKLIPVKQLENV